MTVVTGTQLVTGLGILTGLIVMLLGLVLHTHSFNSEQENAARKISLLGAVLFAASAVIYVMGITT